MAFDLNFPIYMIVFLNLFFVIYLIYIVHHSKLEIQGIREETEKQNAILQHSLHIALLSKRPELSDVSIFEVNGDDSSEAGLLSKSQCFELAKERAKNELGH